MRDRRFAAVLSMLLTRLIFAPTALAMTEERAIERVKAVDPTAVQAVKFWVYPDKDAPSWNYPREGLDGAWVFYAEDRHTLPWHGRAWFVSEDKAVDLGRSEDVYFWDFLEYRNDMNDDGVMLDSGDIFTSETRPDGKEHIHAWTLEDGEVVELYTDGKVYSLETLGDCLCGQAAPGDYDYAFLCLRGGGDLGEIAATPMTLEQFEAFKGSEDVLRVVKDSGFDIDVLLYRYAEPYIDAELDSYLDAGGVVTLNLSHDGVPQGHSYAFILRGTRTVKLMGGWMGDDLGRHEDEQGTAKRDLGYDIVETRLK